MVLHLFLFLLVVCLLLSLALLWCLDWPHLRPSSPRGGAKRSTLHRLLKPCCPDDCPACHLGSTPFYWLKTPSQQIAVIRISRWPKSWIPQRLPGSSAFDKPPSRAFLSRARKPCMSASSSISTSRTSSWTNCAPISAAPNRCCGFGWPSILPRRFFPCSLWVPVHKTWHIRSSTAYDRSWPPFCLPLFTSDGLNVYFLCLSAHFGH